MKPITDYFRYYLDKSKIYQPKFYEIPSFIPWQYHQEFTLTNFQGVIDRVKFVYRNRNSDLHPKIYSSFQFELHWLNNKLYAIYGQEKLGEEYEGDGLDTILWHAVEAVIRCMVEEGYAIKEQEGASQASISS